MMISENSYTINQHGNLKIPSKELIAMGLLAGMHVRVAFLTEDGEKNTFREFLLTQDSLSEIHEESQFQIPAKLLHQANIADDADIQIITVNGGILICQEPSLDVDQLHAISDTLSLALSVTDELSDELPDANEQLRQALFDFTNKEMNGYEYSAGHRDKGTETNRDCD